MYTKVRKAYPGILILMLFFSTLLTNLPKVLAAAQVSVQPPDQTVGQDAPLPTSPFSINIRVDNVANMYGWEIVLYYNSTILNYENITLPPGHVFEGKPFFTTDLDKNSDSHGSFIHIGTTLSGDVSTFSGSGVLCQINFTGQAKGTSSLKLDTTTDGDYYTMLIDPDYLEIPISMVNGQVTVAGHEIVRAPSNITVNVAPATVPVGSNVTVSGDINVTRSGLAVTISNRTAGTDQWNELATVATDSSGHYSYLWSTTDVQIGIYELKVSWIGDQDYKGADSSIASLTVSKKTSTISLNIHPTNVTAGSNVYVSGTITPAPTGVPPIVTVYYRLTGGNWITVAVGSGSNGVYQCTWPNETARASITAGSYEFKASWPGDSQTLSAESSVKTIQVTEAPNEGPDLMAYLPYILAAVAIIAIVAIGIYFTKIRKH